MDFQPNRLTVYTRQALLAEIKRVVDTHLSGHCPTHKEFNKFSRVHSTTVTKEFGSWAEAIRAAGFNYSPHRVQVAEIEVDSRKITPDLLLRELKSIAQKHNGAVFQHVDYKRLGGKRSITTFCKYLGGWTKAVASIGLKDGHSRPRPDLRTYLDEDYFAEMQRLWEMFGRQPMCREMTKYGNISPQSFQQRFGSWMRAVHSFCQDRIGPDGGDPINDVHQYEPVEQAVDNAQTMSDASVAYPQSIIVRPKKRTPRNPSIRLRFRVLQRDNFTCRACVRSPASEVGVRLEVDHILAWSRDGETTFDNLQTLCERCNSGKSNA